MVAQEMPYVELQGKSLFLKPELSFARLLGGFLICDGLQPSLLTRGLFLLALLQVMNLPEAKQESVDCSSCCSLNMGKRWC